MYPSRETPTTSAESRRQNGKLATNKISIDDEETCANCLKETVIDPFRKMNLYKRLPFVKWMPMYSLSYLLRDFIAGITVGLTAIPQGIAYASVAGLQPQYGLYSTIMPCFIYIIFGGCKDITLGPTAIMALMTYPYASAYGAAYSILLCFLSGIIILLASVFQLGFLVNFISLPVTTGFTAAAAFTIASSQIKYFLGLKVSSHGVVDGWISVLKNLNKISWPDTLLGFGTIVALLCGRYIKQKSSKLNGEKTSQKVMANGLWLLGLSGNAIVVICGTLLAYSLSQDGVAPFMLTGPVSGGLPPFEVPPFQTANATFFEMVQHMGSAVLAVPLISIMETVAIGKAFERGKGIDATQEMIALGLANFAGSFISSMPVSGSFTRSAINNTSGVKTPFGGFFTGALVLIALAFLTSYFYFIPKATLAGLIITAMIFMVEYSTIGRIWKTKKTDFIPFCTAFFSCLFFGVEIGMIIGILTNLAIILYRIARPKVTTVRLTINNQKILQVTPKQNLLFPAADHMRELVIEECNQWGDYSPVVIDGSYMYTIDSTTVKSLAALLEDLKSRGQKLYLWRWNESPIRTCLNYSENFRRSLRYDESLEQLLFNESPPSINDEASVKEFSNNNSSNEQLTNVPMSV